MTKQLKGLASIFLLISFLLVTGCGGGGGGVTEQVGVEFNGNESPAAIDASNAQAIGEAAGEAVAQASASGSLPLGIVVSSNTVLERLNQIALSISRLEKFPVGYSEDFSEEFCSSGSVVEQSDDNPEAETGPYDSIVTFSNCVDKETGYTFNGQLAFHDDDIGDPNAAFSLRYVNFTVADDSFETVTLNMTIECENGGCSFSSDFVGRDGMTHRVSNYDISGNATDGYNGLFTFYHDTHGRVFAEVNDATFGDCEGLPDGGSLSFESSSSSGTIEFESDCSVSGSWSNNSGSGSF